MRKTILMAGALVLAAFVVSCGTPLIPAADLSPASAAVEVVVGQADGARSVVSDPLVTAVSVEILSATGAQVGGGALTKGPTYWGAIFDIPETGGTYTFVAHAYDTSGQLLWFGTFDQLISGSATVTVPVVAFTPSPGLDAGTYHSMLLDGNGRATLWGDNSSYKFGIGVNTDQKVPVLSGTDGYVKMVGGSQHTLGLKADGSLWVSGWGSSYGTLGLGATTTAQVPTRIAGTWIDVAAGDLHSLAVASDGTLWAWGWNSSYQIGDGTMTNRTVPTFIDVTLQAGEVFERVAAGRDFSFALTNQGRLYAWGSNSYGKLGVGDYSTHYVPTLVGADTDWESVSCGYSHALAIKTSGAVYGAGSSSDGQLGFASGSYNAFTLLLSGDTVSALAAGDYHSLFIKTDGSLWATGTNDYGQLGDGTLVKRTAPIRVGSGTNWSRIAAGDDFSVAVESGGTTWFWGNNDRYQSGLGYNTDVLSPVNIASGVAKVFSSGLRTWVLDAAGTTLRAWGSNSSGQLGLGDSVNRVVPVVTAAGLLGAGESWIQVSDSGSHAFLLRNDGALYVAGNNSAGTFGDGSTTSSSTFIRVGTDTWLDIAAGYSHSAGVKSDGTLWVWGTADATGKLGNGTSSETVSAPAQIGTATNWVGVDIGENYGVAFNSVGEIWTWGEASYCRLGNDDDPPYPEEPVDQFSPVRIHDGVAWQPASVGADFASGWARTAAGEMYGWGYGYYGQFGFNNWTNQPVPIRFLSGSTVSRFSFGYYHSLTVLSDGTLWSAGNNRDGESGDPAFGYEHRTFGRIGTGTNWVDTVAGNSLSFALDASGELWAFGTNLSFYLTTAAPGHVLVPTVVTLP